MRAPSGCGEAVGVRGDHRRHEPAADHLRRPQRARRTQGGGRDGRSAAAGRRRASSARSCAAWNRTACCARRASSAWARNTTASWSLPDSLPLNLDVREALDLDDTVLEVNATPNRGDCMSVFGIARDYAAAQERRYLDVQRRSGRRRARGGISGEHRSRRRAARSSARA